MYNKIYSEQTQAPYAYTDLEFVCKPASIRNSALNFGEVFQGDRIVDSGLALTVLENITAPIPFCSSSFGPLTKDTADHIISLVQDDYVVEWLVDDLPAAAFQSSSRDIGFPLGVKVTDQSFLLYNLFQLHLEYEKTDQGILITFFGISVSSVKFENEDCSKPSKDSLEIKEGSKFHYCYSIQWSKNDKISWTTRWDQYIDSSLSKLHWFNFFNSFTILTGLSVAVAYYLLTSLQHDIASYNNQEESVEAQDEAVGWKLVHRDVFRSPRKITQLSALVGSGTQIIFTFLITFGFLLLGFLNPSYRGGILQYALISYALNGIFAGYWSARIHKSFKGDSKTWMNNVFVTGTLFPGIFFSLICISNTYFWAMSSSLALPAGTFVALLALWLFVSLPLTLIGGYFGNKKQAIEHPVRINQIPRQVPDQPKYLGLLPSAVIGGLFPFLIFAYELTLIWKSAWSSQYFYMYGFVAIVFAFSVIASIEMTLGMIYYQLIAEDYRWQWKSFWIGGSSSWYMFLFGIGMFISRDGEFSSRYYFFINHLIISIGTFVALGTVGFISTYIFLRRIYGALKVD